MGMDKQEDLADRAIPLAVACCLISLCLAGLVATSLWPFEMTNPSNASLNQALFGSLWLPPERLGSTLLERMPFFLISLLIVSVLRRDATNVVALFGFGIPMIFGLELLQLYADGRHARWIDFFIAIAYFALGAYVGYFLRSGRLRFLAEHLPLLAAIGLTIVSLFLYWRGQATQSLDAWDCEHQLQIGNEESLDRQWIGKIYQVSLTSAGEEINLVPEIPGDAIWSSTDAPYLVLGPVAAETCQSLIGTKDFKVTMILRRGGQDLIGPARILTWSKSIYDQNTMIGEQAERIHFRVKSGPKAFPTVTEIVGDIPESDSNKALKVATTFYSGTMRISINGKMVGAGSSTDIKLNNGLSVPRTPILLFFILMSAALWVHQYRRRQTDRT